MRPSDVDVMALMAHWHGGPAGRSEPAKFAGGGHPAADAANKILAGFSEWFSQQDSFFRPSRSLNGPDPHGQLVFMWDADGDWCWSAAASDGRLCESQDGEPWRELGETPDEFLLHILLLETLIEPAHGALCTHVPNGRLDEVVGQLSRVDFGDWRWPAQGHSVFLGASLIASVQPALERGNALKHSQTESTVRVAGLSPADVAFLDELPGMRFLKLESGF